VKKILEYFSSTKLTIFLIIILAGESVVGSFLYTGDTLPSGQGGVRVFSSPFFVVPSLLLVVNILFCSLERILKSRRKKAIFVAHVFLIGAISGLLIDGKFGVVLTGYFPYGTEESRVYDWKKGKDVKLPFSIEVKSYAEKRHPFLLRVGVKRYRTGEKVALFEVPENGSFRLPGSRITVSQLRFSPKEKKLFFVLNDGRSMRKLEAGIEGSLPINGDYVIVPVAFKDRGVKEMKAELLVKGDGREELLQVAPNDPGEFEGYDISLIEIRTDEYLNLYIGLQLTRKPGEPVFWMGILGFFASTLVHLVGGNRTVLKGDSS